MNDEHRQIEMIYLFIAKQKKNNFSIDVENQQMAENDYERNTLMRNIFFLRNENTRTISQELSTKHYEVEANCIETTSLFVQFELNDEWRIFLGLLQSNWQMLFLPLKMIFSIIWNEVQAKKKDDKRMYQWSKRAKTNGKSSDGFECITQS